MKGIEELSHADLGQALGFISGLAAAKDQTELRDRVLASLHDLVPADSVTFTEIGTASGEARWWTDPPEVGEAGDVEAFAAHLHEHPIASHHAAHGGADAVQFADFLSERELHRLGIYNDFYRPLGVEHQLAIAIDAPTGLNIPISVQSADHGFDLRARAMLELLHPHLTRAYERVEVETRAAALLATLERAEAAAVVILARDGAIEFTGGRATEWLTAYFDRPATPDALPAALIERLEGWREPPGYGDVAESRVAGMRVRAAGRLLTIRYVRSAGVETLLLEERRQHPDPTELRELGLTRREAEVLIAAAAGGTVDELGERLVISPHTVKKHLENIYRKLGVGSRAEALAVATDPATAEPR